MKIFMTAGGSLVLKEWVDLFKNIRSKLICADARENILAHKYCQKVYKIPFGNTPEFVPSIEKIVQQEKPLYMLLHVDEEVITIGEHIDKSSLNPARFLVPIGLGIRNICDKYKLKDIAKGMAILYPESFLLSEIEVSEWRHFPIIIKRRFGRGAKDLFFCDDRKDFEYYVSKIKDPKNFIIQERIDGVIAYFDVLVDGDNIFWIGIEKTKIYFGNGIYDFKTIWDEKYQGFIEKLAHIVSEKSINKKYIINIDVIVRGEDIYLMEINPRPGIVFPVLFNNVDELKCAFKNFLTNKIMIDVDVIKEKVTHIPFLCQVKSEPLWTK